MLSYIGCYYQKNSEQKGVSVTVRLRRNYYNIKMNNSKNV